MVRKYKYINFKLIEQKPKTGIYQCCNNKSGVEIGIVKWYSPWRQYCFLPSADTIFNKGCMEYINDFIEFATKNR